ncbi:MAG: ATP-binding protein [bacterium]|nr:ATP-binding protein [bacterium]
MQELLFRNMDKILHAWMLLDGENQVVIWSRPAAEHFGYSAEEVAGKPFHLLLPAHTPNREEYIKLLELDSHNGSVINHRTQMAQRSGIIMDVELSMHSLHDEENFKLITFANITEATELQHYVNNKMMELVERFHFFHGKDLTPQMREIFDAILVAVTSGQGLKFNRCLLLLVDQDDQELKGVQAIGPANREEAGRIYHELSASPPTLTKMIDLYKSSGNHDDSWINQLVREISVSLADPEHILIQTLFNQKYQLINDSSPMAGHPSFNWLRETLHASECILVPLLWHGQSVGLLVADNSVTGHAITDINIKALTDFAKVTTEVIETVKLLTKLEESITYIKQTNLKIKESQAQLMHQEKLAAKGQLIAQMAHEIRGPMAIIGGFARRVYKRIEPADINYDPVQRIVETVATLELVLNDILDQSPKADEQKTDCDAAKTINRVVALLEEEIHNRRISVNINIKGDLPNIRIKEHHLFEIINNLVKNAIEAMEKDGLLLILANELGNMVVITIQDTGPGIPQAEEAKIFSPYYTTKENGTGLGLVVVQKLVEEHKGMLTVHSLPGKGTTFTISLPTVNKQEES